VVGLSVANNYIINTHPELSQFFCDSSFPLKFTKSSSVRTKVICPKCKKIRDKIIFDFIQHPNCKECGYLERGISKLENSISITHPEKCLYLVNKTDAYKYSFGSTKSIMIFCKVCGIEVCKTVTNFCKDQGCCRKCGKKQGSQKQKIAKIGFSVADKYPEKIELFLNKQEAYLYFPNSSTRVKNTCQDCGKIKTNCVSDLCKQIYNLCKKCVRKKISETQSKPKVGERIIDTHPNYINFFANKDDVYNYSYGSSTLVFAKCIVCNKSRKKPVNDIIGSKGACKKCARCGYNNEYSGFLYLIERNGIIKYGIRNEFSDRIRRHKKNGWLLIEEIFFQCGKYLEKIEKNIKENLRTKKIFPVKLNESGWTETYSYDILKAKSLKEIFEFLGIFIVEN
jgi:hypothetical protein